MPFWTNSKSFFTKCEFFFQFQAIFIFFCITNVNFLYTQDCRHCGFGSIEEPLPLVPKQPGPIRKPTEVPKHRIPGVLRPTQEFRFVYQYYKSGKSIFKPPPPQKKEFKLLEVLYQYFQGSHLFCKYPLLAVKMLYFNNFEKGQITDHSIIQILKL